MKRWLGLALGSLLVLAGMILPSSALAQPEQPGSATIRSRSGDSIDGGGSATEFTIDLPDGAECPGDSANDDYRIGSFMLPATVDPFDVEWSGEGPGPYGLSDYETFRQPLYDDLTSGFSSKLLAENDGPGKPGQILDFPAFTFDVYEPGMIPAGRYRIGIECNLFSEVTTVWDAEIQVEVDPTDVPAQIRWTVVEGMASTESGTDMPTIALVSLVVLVLLAAGATYVLRRRSTQTTHRHDPLR